MSFSLIAALNPNLVRKNLAAKIFDYMIYNRVSKKQRKVMWGRAKLVD
jgi:hypothetical protein